MITFSRYPHVQDLFEHYANTQGRDDVLSLLKKGVCNSAEAETLCRFAWTIAELINQDEEQGNEVLGSKDNTDMLADLSYEMGLCMKDAGFYPVWQRVSNEEMS